jgi:hypothetical protein
MVAWCRSGFVVLQKYEAYNEACYGAALTRITPTRAVVTIYKFAVA